MSLIEFDASLHVGNRLMDQEHEVLISYINLLQKAVEHEASTGIIEKVLDGVVEYTKTHFFLEEELMKAYNYPERESHIKAHEGFRQEAQKLVEQFERGEGEITDSVLQFLKGWLVNHILKIDVQLAEFLKDKKLSG